MLQLFHFPRSPNMAQWNATSILYLRWTSFSIQYCAPMMPRLGLSLNSQKVTLSMQNWLQGLCHSLHLAHKPDVMKERTEMYTKSGALPVIEPGLTNEPHCSQNYLLPMHTSCKHKIRIHKDCLEIIKLVFQTN